MADPSQGNYTTRQNPHYPEKLTYFWTSNVILSLSGLRRGGRWLLNLFNEQGKAISAKLRHDKNNLKTIVHKDKSIKI